MSGWDSSEERHVRSQTPLLLSSCSPEGHTLASKGHHCHSTSDGKAQKGKDNIPDTFSTEDSKKSSHALAGGTYTSGKACQHSHGPPPQGEWSQAARASVQPASCPGECKLPKLCLNIVCPPTPSLSVLSHYTLLSIFNVALNLRTLGCYFFISTQTLKHLDSPNDPLTPPPFTSCPQRHRLPLIRRDPEKVESRVVSLSLP